MKIIFDSEEERERTAIKLAGTDLCPNILGFEEGACNSECIACWELALEREEVRKNGA